MARHIVPLLLCLLRPTACAPVPSEVAEARGEEGDVLEVETFEWVPEPVVVAKTVAPASPFVDPTLAATHAAPRPKGAAVKSKVRHFQDEAPAPGQKRAQQQLEERLSKALPGGRRLEASEALQAVWNRPQYRSKRFDLLPTPGEHPCFAGFQHMVSFTDRCAGGVRSYPGVGERVLFQNTGMERKSHFTLKAVVAGTINVWLEEGSTAEHEDLAIKAAKIYTNELDIPELHPTNTSRSWMEHECKIMGSMPFMYSCSNKVNILVQQCGVANAWVIPSDYLRNYPGPITKDDPPNADIVFYMCQEILDSDPNPYAAANTFAHELAHVIQGGFGHSFNTMTEGGATWLEGPLLNLPPRPMVYAWGFQDWNRILAAHIYANTKELNARKFYQIHGMFLAYLSQPALLGDHCASALQNYQTFDSTHSPFGRNTYDYYLQHIGSGQPNEFVPIRVNVSSTSFAFADALLNYRVALAAQCILEADLRPSEPQYQMPTSMRERPYWDCSSFPVHWSTDGDVHGTSAEIHYGGAAVFRLALPRDATVSVAADADPLVRTKVLAAGVPSGPRAEVRELSAGESVRFEGLREIYVVQVNVDPEGEMIAPGRAPLWRTTCDPPCESKAWWAGPAPGGELYAPNMLSSLQSPLVALPETKDGLELTFDAKWDMEAEVAEGTIAEDGCCLHGWDGVQVRVLTTDAAGGEKATVLKPSGPEGYGNGARGSCAVAALASAYHGEATCNDLAGWTGSSGGWTSQRFSLSDFANRTVRIEWLFASDGSVAGEGFWVDRARVRARGALVFEGRESEFTMQRYSASPRPGELGRHDGVPVVAALPSGYTADDGLTKVMQTRSAPWSASWSVHPRREAEDLRRAYLGWSYAAPTYARKTLWLHPGQEACVLQRAPFRGVLRVATLFTLLDKIGVGAATLALRETQPPYALVNGSRLLLSSSPGVQDPGTHGFAFGRGPVFEEGSAFLTCVGVEERRLPADDPARAPFLHLPLRAIPTAGERGAVGATALLRPGEALTTELDPWKGHTFVLRSEFVEVATGAATPTRGFLSTSSRP